MNNFERVYQIDPSRESDHKREIHPSIELSDEMIKKDWVYREPCKVDENLSEVIKQKQSLAEALSKESFTIDKRKNRRKRNESKNY